MTMSAVIATYREQEAESRERFDRDTAGHRMRVFHDDGLYRHLRFSRPGTWSYGYDLVTWPGHLAITGDVGDYDFARLADMFQFFRGDAGGINPQYWAEKITNRDAAAGTRRFDSDLFRPRVMEWYRDHCEGYGEDELPALRAALEEQVFSAAWDGPHSRDQAIGLLMEFEHEGVQIYEPYEMSFERWDWTYLWSCWAIVQGIAQYDWEKGWTAETVASRESQA